MAWLTRKADSVCQKADYRFDHFGRGRWELPVPATADFDFGSWISGNITSGSFTFSPIDAGNIAGAETPFYPNTFSAVSAKAVGIDGTTGAFEQTGAATVFDTTKITIFGTFMSRITNASTEVVFAQDSGGGSTRNFTLRTNPALGRFDLYAWDGGGVLRACTTASNGLLPGQMGVFCGVIDRTTGRMHLNFNGNASSQSYAGLISPIQIMDPIPPLRIGAGGAAGVPTYRLNGWIQRLGWIQNYAATDAECAAIVKQMMNQNSVSTVRASVEAMQPKSASLVHLAGPGMLAITEDGAQIFQAGTSRLPYNQRSTQNPANGGIFGAGSGWTLVGSPTLVGVVDAPDGSMTAERITVGVFGTNDVYITAGGFTGSAALTWGIWVRPVTSGTLVLRNPATGLSGKTNIDLSTLSGWTRIIPGHPSTSQDYAWVATVGGGAGIRLSAGADTITFDVWRPWQVEGNFPGPDLEMQATTTGIRQATVATIASPMGTVPVPFGVMVTAKCPYWGGATDRMQLFGMGATNPRIVFHFVGNNTLSLSVFGDSGADKIWSRNVGALAPGSEHTFGFVYDPVGHTAKLMLDGTEFTSVTVSGTGVLAPGSYPGFTLGSAYFAGQKFLNGYLKSCTLYWPVTDFSKMK